MAIDLVDKKRNLARKIIQNTALLLAATAELKECANEYTSSGVEFIDSDFTGIDTLKHVDAASMASAITSITTLNAWLESTFNDDNLYKILQ